MVLKKPLLISRERLMSEFQLKTPVAFIIFNRPDTTERVFAEIARARPAKLLVVGDGPRANRPGEAEKVAACRAIIHRVNWPCEVLTNYSETNMGCKMRVSSGLDWVFEQVPEAIILEDDCLPHPTFFRFCQEMLERYRDDERIGMISGDNFQFGQVVTTDSYYFSKYTHIWGWATWRRAWSGYDVEASIWPILLKEGWLKQISENKGEEAYWHEVFQSVYDGGLDTWDYQWTLRCFAQGQVSVMPNLNLISNIGFAQDATHTIEKSIYANMAVKEMSFPLKHPEIIRANPRADTYTAGTIFHLTFLDRLKKYFFSIF